MTNIFDSHAHYDDSRFDADRDAVLSELPLRGIVGVMNAASDLASAGRSIELAEKYDFVYAAAGVHPHEAREVPADLEDRLAVLLKHPKVMAVGEIGLDYHYDFSPRDIQIKVFELQLQVALEHDLPVIVHDREAHGDTLRLLKKYAPKGVVHCYSGSAEMAAELLALGFYIGFTGVVTFKNARKVFEAARAVPLDRLLIETDCPYMAPEPHRGKRCDSSMLTATAAALAGLRGLDTQELLNLTCENARAAYHISCL